MVLPVPDGVIGKKVRRGIQEVFKKASATLQGTVYGPEGCGHIHSLIHSFIYRTNIQKISTVYWTLS